MNSRLRFDAAQRAGRQLITGLPPEPPGASARSKPVRAAGTMRGFYAESSPPEELTRVRFRRTEAATAQAVWDRINSTTNAEIERQEIADLVEAALHLQAGGLTALAAPPPHHAVGVPTVVPSPSSASPSMRSGRECSTGKSLAAKMEPPPPPRSTGGDRLNPPFRVLYSLYRIRRRIGQPPGPPSSPARARHASSSP